MRRKPWFCCDRDLSRPQQHSWSQTCFSRTGETGSGWESRWEHEGGNPRRTNYPSHMWASRGFRRNFRESCLDGACRGCGRSGFQRGRRCGAKASESGFKSIRNEITDGSSHFLSAPGFQSDLRFGIVDGDGMGQGRGSDPDERGSLHPVRELLGHPVGGGSDDLEVVVDSGACHASLFARFRSAMHFRVDSGVMVAGIDFGPEGAENRHQARIKRPGADDGFLSGILPHATPGGPMPPRQPPLDARPVDRPGRQHDGGGWWRRGRHRWGGLRRRRPFAGGSRHRRSRPRNRKCRSARHFGGS